MVLCFDLGNIDGAVLAALEIFVGGPRLRANNVSGAFGNILVDAVFKWISLGVGKRFDRNRVCHDDDSS